MSEQKNFFLYIGEDGKADWGVPEGYPYKGIGTVLDGTFEFADGDGVYIHQITDENFSYADGKSYIVIWDGEVYQCVAFVFSGIPVLGNPAILGAGADTGEPFLFLNQGDGQKVIGTTDTATTHTITVRGEIVYPMDNEYLHLQNSNIINGLADGSLRTRDAKEATGRSSFAEGQNTAASGDSAHAEGDSTVASGYSAHAEGDRTVASSNSAHAEGQNTIASGFQAHAEGKNTIASGDTTHAEGDSTVASSDSAHAEGYETVASSNFAHAEGQNTIASGFQAHAEGCGTAASSNSAHAEGCGTIVYITISGEAGATVYTITSSISSPIIEGSIIKYNNQIVRKILSYNSSEKKITLNGTLNNDEALNSIKVMTITSGIASSDYSHSEGHGSIALSESQHVQGKFNIGDSSNKYAHIVGNGSASNSRSNAHTIDWDGNAWFAGTVEGTAMIVKSSTEGSTKKFKITVDDSGTISATEITT